MSFSIKALHRAEGHQVVGDDEAVRPARLPEQLGCRLVATDAGAAADYDRLYCLYRDLYPATRNVAHELADIAKDRA
jgi:hypothetical protein